jgi:hypothetical protein
MKPFAANRVADVGDVHFDTVYNLEEAISDIERFFAGIALAGAIPITAGGDHSITYPILKPLASLSFMNFLGYPETIPDSRLYCFLESISREKRTRFYLERATESIGCQEISS